MKNKKIITALLLLGLISPFGIQAIEAPSCIMTVSADSTYSTYEDFQYSVQFGKIQIEKYTGSDEEVTVPAVIDGINVSRIDDYAFSSNSETLKSVILPEGLEEIGRSAFEYCKLLEKVYIPDSITLIDSHAFDDTAIVNSQQSGFVYIGNYIYTYKGSAFTDSELSIRDSTVGFCSNFYNIPCNTFDGVKTVNIPDSIKDISKVAPFYLGKVCGFNVSQDNKTYSSKDGVLFSKDMTTLIRYPGGRSDDSYTVPEHTTVIGQKAFADSTNLRHVTLPSELNVIKPKAFWSVPLEDIDLPSSLDYIDDFAFTFTGVSKVTLPESVRYLGYGSFAGCENLTDFTIMNTKCTIDRGQLDVAECTISDFCPNPEEICYYDNIDEYGRFTGGVKGPYCDYSGTIHGYLKSTAEQYAEGCNYNFIALDQAGQKDTVTQREIFGDVDLNGVIELNDLTKLSLFLLHDIDLDEKAKLNADVVWDGELNLADLATLKQYLLLEDVQLGPAE